MRLYKDGFGIDDDCIVVVCPGNHDIIRDNTVICETPKGKKILYPRPDSKKTMLVMNWKGFASKVRILYVAKLLERLLITTMQCIFMIILLSVVKGTHKI